MSARVSGGAAQAPVQQPSDIAVPRYGEIQPFNPRQTRGKLARLDGEIVTARQLHDWPKLEEAANEKVAEIARFVDNWDLEVVPTNQSHARVRSNAETKSVDEAEAEWHISQQTVSRWREALRNVDAFLQRIILGAHRKAGLEVEENRRVNTGEYEWYTPARYIEAAREVMGGIDLDPASHEVAQQTVQAAHYFTAQDDGLKLDWYGRVWLNPPYAQPLMQNFVRKLVAEYACGNVEQAIMLTHNYTDTAWFHEAQADAALCFTRGRISFVGASGPPTQGQCFFYFGDRTDAFRATFRAFGFIR